MNHELGMMNKRMLDADTKCRIDTARKKNPLAGKEQVQGKPLRN